MSLPSLSVRRPVATTMVYAAVVVLGAVSFTRLRVDLLPDVAFPTLTVYTAYPDVGPAEIERFITEPVEAAVARVPGVERVTSISREGASLVTLRFAWGTDMDVATLQVRERLDQLRYALPMAAGRPTILRTDPGSEPVLSIAAAGADLVSLKDLAEDVFRRRLEQIDGVAQAAVVGGLEREIHVAVDPARLETLGVTMDEVARALEAANYTAPGGTVRRGALRYALRALGEFRSLDEIAATVIKRGPAGARVLLRDVATVEDGFRERETVARYNGRESVGLLVFKEPAANSVRVAERAERVLDELRAEFPGISLEVAWSEARFIADAIANVVQALVLGGLLAFLVLFLFLRDPRWPLAIAVSIPLSVAVAFACLFVAGVSLNIMTLGGLALGIGMLVDSSIVVLENAVRRREQGAGPVEAAVAGADEVAAAITAATLTTVAVFLPVLYVRGVAGALFGDLALAVTFSLLASLAVALTLVPVLVARLGGRAREGGPAPVRDAAAAPQAPGPERGAPAGGRPGRVRRAVRRFTDAYDRGYARFAARYEALLAAALDRKGRVAAAAVVALALAVALGAALPRDLLPPVDENEFSVRLDLPLGTPLDETERVAARLEATLLADPDVRAVFARIGRARGAEIAEQGTGGANQARLDVRLRDGARTPPAVARFLRTLPPLPPDAVAVETGRATALGRILGTAEADLVVRARGADLDAALALAREVRARLEQLPRLANVRLGYHAAQPEIRVEVNRERAAHYGLPVRTVADAAHAYLRGRVPTQFVDFDEKVDILVRPPEDVRRDLGRLLAFRVGGVPLGELVRVEETLAPVEIVREGQDRVVPVYADVAQGGLDAAIAAVRAALGDLRPPPGVRLEVGGANEEMRASFRSLAFAFALALFLVYLVLAAQFESFVHPLTILCAVPLAGIGAVAALALAGAGLNVMSGIGFVILVGIVVNNAIVEVDFAVRAQRAGAAPRAAALEAGRVRLRPILMTTVTTVLGLLPMALGLGAGADLRAPLAVAVIGGLVSSTALTLVVVPVVYETVETARARWTGRRRPGDSGADTATAYEDAGPATPPGRGPRGGAPGSGGGA